MIISDRPSSSVAPQSPPPETTYLNGRSTTLPNLPQYPEIGPAPRSDDQFSPMEEEILRRCPRPFDCRELSGPGAEGSLSTPFLYTPEIVCSRGRVNKRESRAEDGPVGIGGTGPGGAGQCG
jgi:hypothetical protein